MQPQDAARSNSVSPIAVLSLGSAAVLLRCSRPSSTPRAEEGAGTNAAPSSPAANSTAAAPGVANPAASTARPTPRRAP